MANAEQLARLVSSVSEWNAWRIQNEEEKIDLRKVHLTGAKLEGVDLSEADLEGANLMGAHLEGANLEGARLNGANLVGAHLEKALLGESFLRGSCLNHAVVDGATLWEASLEGAQLRGARLTNARLTRVFMKDADLQDAILEGASLPDAVLAGACLRDANLKGAELDDADLKRADLAGANLEGANLTDALGCVFSGTYTRNARLGTRPKDPWSGLRRRYTGPMLLFNVILLLAFVSTYVVEAMMWRTVNQLQVARTTKEMLDNLGAVGPCLQVNCKEIPIWKVLFGIHRGATEVLMAMALLAYNLLRGLLTWRVGLLRDEEDRSGYTPEYRMFWGPDAPRRLAARLRWAADGYWYLHQVHRAMTVLVIPGVLSVVYNASALLSSPVWIPA